jgi:hypothetical protein
MQQPESTVSYRLAICLGRRAVSLHYRSKTASRYSFVRLSALGYGGKMMILRKEQKRIIQVLYCT